MQRPDARSIRSGRCKLCGHVFLWMRKAEYNSIVARHIQGHREQIDDRDATIVEPL